MQKAFLESPEAMALVRETMRPSDVDPAAYDAIFFVGGHGTMWDFPDNAELATIAATVHERGGVEEAAVAALERLAAGA